MADHYCDILELFAGSCSIAKEAHKFGLKTKSVDIYPFEGVDWVIDIAKINETMINFRPFYVWASIPCTSYSIAACYHHRENLQPKTLFAEKSDALAKHTRSLIESLNCLYTIENPRGLLRKMPFMKGLDRRTVWYCRYGDKVAKPTDLWSNFFYTPLFDPYGWQVRAECFNGNSKCHHEKSPRKAAMRKLLGLTNSGTQGRKGNYERSIVPPQLASEALKSAIYFTVKNDLFRSSRVDKAFGQLIDQPAAI